MFENSLLDSGGRGRTKKPATVAISFLMQSVAVGILILIPLVYTEALPQHTLTRLFMAPPPPPPPPAVVVFDKVRVRLEKLRRPQQLTQPLRIPDTVAMITEDPTPPSLDGYIGVDVHSVRAGEIDGLITAIETPPPPPAPELERIPVGGVVMAAKLMYQVTPVYPPLASKVHVQGTVRLQALISKQGEVINLRAVSGHPMLIPAALHAVRQWRYQPTLLNGVPVEVETTVEVNFKLGG